MLLVLSRSFLSDAKTGLPQTLAEKPVAVSAGLDDFKAILQGTPPPTRTTASASGNNDYQAAAAQVKSDVAGADIDRAKAKGKDDGKAQQSRLVASPEDIGKYVDGKGPTRDCWVLLADHVKTVFGAVEAAGAEEKGGDDIETADDKVRTCVTHVDLPSPSAFLKLNTCRCRSCGWLVRQAGRLPGARHRRHACAEGRRAREVPTTATASTAPVVAPHQLLP